MDTPTMPPGRDDIPLDHPRRIARIAHLSERELQHEPEHVRRACAEYRAKVARRGAGQVLGQGEGSVMTAEQCRRLGIEVGDVVVGRETWGNNHWNEAELTLLWLGQTVAVFRVRERTDRALEWGMPRESANWTLSCREWQRPA